MDIKQHIAHKPMGRFQWLVVGIAVVLNILDGFDVLAVAFTAKSIKTELGLDNAQIGTLISAGLFGMTVGALILGPAADKFGRRPVLIFSTALAALGMLLTYFAHSTEAIAASRFVTGLGVGGILPCTNVLVSEYSNKKWRGLAIAIYASGFGIGAMLGGISAVSLQDAYGWRAVFLTGAVLTGLAFFALLAILPESVDFLANKRPQGWQEKLGRIAAKIGLPAGAPLPEAAPAAAKAPLMRLFERGNLRTTLLIWAAFIAVTASFYFISSWTPALLEEAGMAKAKSQTVGMAISIGGTFGSLAFGLFASRFSAQKILIAFSVLSAAAVCVFVLAGANLTLGLMMAVALGFLVNGCIAGLYALNPTLYAAEYRSTGVGTAIGMGRIGSIVSPMLVGILLDAGYQKNQLYFGVAVIMLAAAAVLWLLKPKQHV